jgi:hypothetical protein
MPTAAGGRASVTWKLTTVVYRSSFILRAGVSTRRATCGEGAHALEERKAEADARLRARDEREHVAPQRRDGLHSVRRAR